MYQLTSHDDVRPDVAAFVDMVNGPEGRALFEPGGEVVVVARAPGRLDVMGGIADYSGALVLEMPTREATQVALQRDGSARLQITSLGAEANGRAPDFEMGMDALLAMDYAGAQAFFRRDAKRAWAAYVAGVFCALQRECGAEFPGGVRMLIASDVPEGKGVSSSAALEVAVMQVVVAAFGASLAPREMALLCQKVENLVVGAPCGVMDQMTAVCGGDGELLALLCQPAELQGAVAVPDEVACWGIDSGIRHAVSGADYGSVRVGAFMGYRMLADLAGLKVRPGSPVKVDDPRWGGYLANVTPSVFEQYYAGQIPEAMAGADFLARYGGTTDAVTQVDPARVYAVRMPTRHPVYEHFRVQAFGALLPKAEDEGALRVIGELMYQAHASYSACGLGSDGTDQLVEMVREAGTAQGLYGAKITGGGSGGTVAVLGRKGSDAAVREIADCYAAETGRVPYLFSGSSPGAAAFGHARLKWAGA